MNRIPLIIDTDAGSDDAIALLMVNASQTIDLKAVTVVSGNVDIRKATDNILRIESYVGIDTPVAVGSYPLMKEFIPCDAECIGTEGLGGAVLPPATKRAVDKCAVETIYEHAVKENGNLELLCVGPLSNIALFINTHPNVKNLIKHITIMGGAVNGGNTSCQAEFNIYTDPEAAKIVFASGIPVTMIGIDVCNKTKITSKDLENIINTDKKVSKFLGELMWYPPKPGYQPIPEDGWPLFDALAAAAVINRDIMDYGHYYVDVETKGEFTSGKTVVDTRNLLKKKANTYVAENCNKQMLINMLNDTLDYYEK